MTLLDVRGLRVGFGESEPVLAGLDLSIAAGETVALVGESGSGKSLTALSIVRLLPRGATILSGDITFAGEDVLAMRSGRMNRLRGGGISMLFQQPRAALDPSATVGSQVAEAVRLHTGVRGASAMDRVVELLREVGIPAPETRVRSYAHQLSGGMAQRVMMACALAGNPKLLIADEPTTALDVTVQLQVLQLLARERADRGLATLLITHDLGVVSALADRILVLYAGRVVEQGPGSDILGRPQHPYTRALVRASLLQAEPDGRLFAIRGTLSRDGSQGCGCRFLPRCATADALAIHGTCASHEPDLAPHGAPGQLVRCCAAGAEVKTVRILPAAEPFRTSGMTGSAASLRGVKLHHRLGAGRVIRSLDEIDLEVRTGETLGLVGESGCGKSTLARVLLNVMPPTAGEVHAVGHDLADLRAGESRALRRDAQLIFQDPTAALDPRMRLGDSLRVVLDHNGIGERASRRQAVLRALNDVGLLPSFYDRRPSECSGGQLQRAVIARALLMTPKLLVCDEPTSALDASIRAQILNLIGELRTRQADLSILMITHDLRVVRHLCDRVAVMYLGEIVEVTDTATLFGRPTHPYTQALVAASLIDQHSLEGAAGRVRGEPPDPLNLPTGCRYNTRCSLADVQCIDQHPPLSDIGDGHLARCWRWQAAASDIIAADVAKTDRLSQTDPHMF